jgi:hypothetical protein
MKGFVAVLVLTAGLLGLVRLGRHPPPGHRGPTAVRVRALPECGLVAARAVEKDRVLARLAAGQTRLIDAARAFLTLNRAWPPVPSRRYDRYPGRSLVERVARHVVELVETRLKGDPRRDKVLARLAAELAELAAAHRPPAGRTVGKL